MKKISFILAIASVATLFGCSCSRDDIKAEGTLTAVALCEGDVTTKMAVTLKDASLEWQAGDTLAICSSTSGSGKFVPFAIVGGGRSLKASFSGPLSLGSIKDCAVYPYISGKTPYFKGGELYVTFPESFQRWEGSTMAPMYAEGISEDGVMNFRKIGSIVGVQLTKVPTGTASVKIVAGCKISGDFKVDRSGEYATVYTDKSESYEDRMMTTTFSTLSAAQETMWFNFPLPAGDYSYLRIQACSEDGEVIESYRTNSEISLNRGEVCTLVPGDDPLPRFASSAEIKVSSKGVENAKYTVSLKNNASYGWTLSVESFSGCVSAASVEGNILTYSVPANPDTTATASGSIILLLSDPTGAEAPVRKTFTITQQLKATRYYTKVTAEKADWSGTYLLASESEMEAYLMYTDENYSDSDCPSFIVPIEDEGIAYGDDTAPAILTIRKHQPDGSNVVKKAQAGKYTLFLQTGTTGIGRYASTVDFGFNNNDSYGRFIETITWSEEDKCVKISCLDKTGKDCLLKFDSAFFTFGMGYAEKVSDARFCDVQLYELK